jgi:hypothetical protein
MRRWQTLVLLVLLVLLAAPLTAAPPREIAGPPRLSGLWQGIILYDPAQIELETTVEIAADPQGKLVGTIDLPSQRMQYYPLKDIRQDGTKISFTFYRDSEKRGPNSPFVFDGTISADGRVLEGIFTGFYNEEKGNDRVPFRFERIGEAGDDRPAPVKPPLQVFSGAGDPGDPLREAFNRDAGGVRLILMLSPT